MVFACGVGNVSDFEPGTIRPYHNVYTIVMAEDGHSRFEGFPCCLRENSNYGGYEFFIKFLAGCHT